MHKYTIFLLIISNGFMWGSSWVNQQQDTFSALELLAGVATARAREIALYDQKQEQKSASSNVLTFQEPDLEHIPVGRCTRKKVRKCEILWEQVCVSPDVEHTYEQSEQELQQEQVLLSAFLDRYVIYDENNNFVCRGNHKHQENISVKFIKTVDFIRHVCAHLGIKKIVCNWQTADQKRCDYRCVRGEDLTKHYKHAHKVKLDKIPEEMGLWGLFVRSEHSVLKQSEKLQRALEKRRKKITKIMPLSGEIIDSAHEDQESDKSDNQGNDADQASEHVEYCDDENTELKIKRSRLE